ncbi:MAG: hypothetical protein IIX35_06680, partial [Paraprevotella sp.]|nr:hypothetical protein [Paraprevotella sp.]
MGALFYSLYTFHQSIDSNDTITLKCNGESLYFVVKNINRNKAEVDLKNHNELIKGKYKVIVTHKPIEERKLYQTPLFVSKNQAFELFEKSIEEYNYEALKQTLEQFNVENISEE